MDRKRTAMEVARSRFAAAQKDLTDTRLTAPFAGIVARRLADNFQNVQAKEPVVSLQNPDALEIVIHVPERVVRGEPRRAAGFAVFDDLPERRLPVTLKSFATEADPQTQTYEVVLSLTPPPDLRLLPGMGVEVLPDTAGSRIARTDTDGEEAAAGAAPVLIPIAAAALEKRTIAWLGCILPLVGGWISHQQLGRFEDPEFIIREVVIATPYPGALPTQVAEESRTSSRAPSSSSRK